MCLLDVELTLDRNIITMEVKAQDEKLRGTLSFVSASLEHWMQETKNDFKNVIQINIKGETK